MCNADSPRPPSLKQNSDQLELSTNAQAAYRVAELIEQLARFIDKEVEPGHAAEGIALLGEILEEVRP